MEPKDTYTLRDLYNDLDIPLTELGRRAGISDVTLAKIRDGASARRSTINSLLRIFSEIYDVKLSTDNVKGIIIKDKLARREEAENAEKTPVPKTAKVVPEKPQKRAYKPRETDLPEGCILATDFARTHGVAPTTFRDHMMIGLGPGTVPGEAKDRVGYSERNHPSRTSETERYLTPDQQAAALEFWKRHGIEFKMPESEKEFA